MILSDFSFPKKNIEYHVHKNVHKYDYTLIQGGEAHEFKLFYSI